MGQIWKLGKQVAGLEDSLLGGGLERDCREKGSAAMTPGTCALLHCVPRTAAVKQQASEHEERPHPHSF